MAYYMGIDGGGTKTISLLSDDSGTIIGKGAAGPSNYNIVGIDQAREALHGAMKEAMATSGHEIRQFENITLGMAGVDRPGDHRVIADMLEGIDCAYRSCTIENDAVIALAGATVAKPGVVIIAGTGSIAFGINDRGERRRAGGWGPILGDEGSGYDIGRRALVAVMQHNDGRGPATSLTELILAHFSLHNPHDLVGQVYFRGVERHEIAALARYVVAAANDGDSAAQGILTYAAEELARSAGAVIRGLTMEQDTFDTALCGGVFSVPGVLQDTFGQFVSQVAPQAQVVPPRFSPVIGALLLALKRDGLLTQERIDNIQSTVNLPGR